MKRYLYLTELTSSSATPHPGYQETRRDRHLNRTAARLAMISMAQRSSMVRRIHIALQPDRRHNI